MADKSTQIVVTASLFLLLTWIAVGLRVYCRAYLVRSLGIDDKLMAFLLLWWILELMNVVSTCLLKISVGFFLLRVAVDRPHVWILRVLMAGTVFFGATYLAMVAAQCRPLSTYWTQGPRTPGHCWPRQVIYVMTIAATVVNTGADFVFGTLPWFIVRSLNIPLGNKIVVVCILGLAAMTFRGSTATIVRAFYIPSLLESDNFLYETSGFAIWSTVEPGVGMIAASIATLRPLYRLIVSKLHGSLGSRNPRAAEREMRARQQARRNETRRMVRRAHNLDTESGPVGTDIMSPRGIFEVEPRLGESSKYTNSTNRVELSHIATIPESVGVVNPNSRESSARPEGDPGRAREPTDGDSGGSGSREPREHGSQVEDVRELSSGLFSPRIAWEPPQVSPFSSSWSLRTRDSRRSSQNGARTGAQKSETIDRMKLDGHVQP
ncbi:Integral membrane protein [Colletotrichum higginsianum IMI 349063]|uniref:Integral membrane protein n=1 Tax=Colletotrichum higginsianum (strain IMI 349063) TaxID=759273 RepID=A0A1B7YR85_COLHI|nr:Integral membrane protein [Colletotrichum higginsianum IMI 349063]OBR14555.1 Integral membrane protein [Colletotrichum higginsianum IMI 349063]